MQKVRVRFNRNVLGRRAGTVAWIDATPMVETLVRVGFLKWLDEPVQQELPIDWHLDESQTDHVELPTGETIPVDELLTRLQLEDDGAPVTNE